uniref:cysteine desulfurase n=1 Tax=Roseihalotalea indica TaxID=2867963 RepID=A0AA49JHJ9_9BACT|nr:cysteine desulfurase family protein [Tunicatimonas sp. TK19036]
MSVYLDNAATTALDAEVLEAMMPYMTNFYGNPSSTHSHGRETRSAIEKARKLVADLLNATPSEIFFTSGGTEADNTAIRCSIEAYGIKRAITSQLEHHAVLHTLHQLEKYQGIQIDYVETDAQGNIDFTHLETLLKQPERAFVSLMHGNNEIGNLTDIQKVGGLCAEYNAIFHSDTVQTLAHYSLDLKNTPVHCIAGSAHKFHGPKGIGILYIAKGHKINPLLHGGGQERNMRGGTENLYGIVGLAKALELSYMRMDQHTQYIRSLKQQMIEGLRDKIPDVQFNGMSDKLDESLYTVLNVSLPPAEDNSMLLFNLDLHQISASGGSACASGAQLGSHVLRALSCDPQRGAIRFSFSRHNTPNDIEHAVNAVASLYPVNV